MSKKYPIGQQNFESLRNDGFFYVDKTEMVYELATNGKYFFLSRPRRFGKSLLVSTLEAYFQGKRELFKGLAIEQLEKDWTVHPVLHLDLVASQYKSVEDLRSLLNTFVAGWENIYGKDAAEQMLSTRFAGVIRRACQKTGEKVVVLIDEYDKPLLESIGNEKLQNDLRDELRAFYSVLKSQDANLRFGLLTGVTKFGKLSVFSGLNNLMDISMQRDYATICGITEKELHGEFKDDLKDLADANEITYEEACKEMKELYDGYHFAYNAEDIYNPFSVLNTFATKEFGSYWIETGTPTYLVKLLQLRNYNLNNLSSVKISATKLLGHLASDTDAIPVIYQSGYLTIKNYDKVFKLYTLGFPNREVEEGFIEFLIPFYVQYNGNDYTFEISNFVHEVGRGDIDAFFSRLQTFFADTPYEMIVGHTSLQHMDKEMKEKAVEKQLELHYQNVLFIVFRLMGFYTKVEYHTAQGRIDLVLQTKDYCYVMEFKLNGTAEEALAQIDAKQYAAPFAHSGKKIFKIGVNFSSKTRNIDRWIVM